MEKAQVEVYVNNEAAKARFDEIQAELKDIKRLRDEAFSKGDTKAFDQYNKEFKKLGRESRALQKEVFDVDRVLQNLAGSTVGDLEKAMRKLRLEEKKLVKGTKEYDVWEAKMKRLKTHQRGLNAEMRKQNSIIKNIAGGFNHYFAIAAAGMASVLGVQMKAQQALDAYMDRSDMAGKVKALTKLSDEAYQYLEKRAVEFSTFETPEGIRIQKTTDEILEAFQLVGSARPELLKNKEALADVTREILIQAEAAEGMPLKDAIDATTKAMNQYGAATEETAKFTNAMSAGAQVGAVQIPEIGEAIKEFGVNAKKANDPIERSVALIELVGEKAGKTGSKGGIQIRNFYNALAAGADETNPEIVGLTQALENLDKQNLSSAEYAQLFGKENANTASIIVEYREYLQDLETAITGSNTAYEQAIENTRDERAALQQAKNAAHEYAVEVGEKLLPAQTRMIRTGRTLLKMISATIDLFTGDPVINKLKEEQTQVITLSMKLADVNTTTEERVRLLRELKTLNPDVVAGLDAENLSYETLRKNIAQYNTDLSNRIILENQTKEQNKAASKLAQARTREAQWLASSLSIVEQANAEIAFSEQDSQEKIKQTIAYLENKVALQKESGEAGRVASDGTDFRTNEQKWLSALILRQDSYNRNMEDRIQLEGEVADLTQQQIELQKILGIYNKPSSGGSTTSTSTSSESGNVVAAKQKQLTAAQQLEFKLQELYNNAYRDNSQLGGSMPYQMVKLSPEEEEEIDEEFEFLNNLFVSSADNQRAIIEARHKFGIDSEEVYQAKLTQLLEEGNDERKAKQEEAYRFTQDLATDIGILIGETLADQEASFDQFGKSMVLMALKTLKSLIPVFTAQIIGREFATKGPLGIITSAGLSTALMVAVAAAESKVKSSMNSGYYYGGYGQSGNDWEVDGVKHKNEWVAPAWMTRSPTIAPKIAELEEIRRNPQAATVTNNNTKEYHNEKVIERTTIPAFTDSDAVNFKSYAQMFKYIYETAKSIEE